MGLGNGSAGAVKEVMAGSPLMQGVYTYSRREDPYDAHIVAIDCDILIRQVSGDWFRGADALQKFAHQMVRIAHNDRHSEADVVVLAFDNGRVPPQKRHAHDLRNAKKVGRARPLPNTAAAVCKDNERSAIVQEFMRQLQAFSWRDNQHVLVHNPGCREVEERVYWLRDLVPIWASARPAIPPGGEADITLPWFVRRLGRKRAKHHGDVSRLLIQTTDTDAIPITMQMAMVMKNTAEIRVLLQTASSNGRKQEMFHATKACRMMAKRVRALSMLLALTGNDFYAPFKGVKVGGRSIVRAALHPDAQVDLAILDLQLKAGSNVTAEQLQHVVRRILTHIPTTGQRNLAIKHYNTAASLLDVLRAREVQRYWRYLNKEPDWEGWDPVSHLALPPKQQ